MIPINFGHPHAQGLTHFWPFNERGGGKAFDAVGANHGTLTNGPVAGTTKLGLAGDFDGTNDYADVGVIAVADDTPWTFMCRVVFDDVNVRGLFGNQFTSGNYTRFFINNSSNFYIANDANAQAQMSAGTTITAGTLYHLALVCDGTSSSNIRLYVNGVLGSTGTLADSSLTIRKLASLGSASSNTLDGRMQDVRLYNRACSLREVQEIYADPTALFAKKRPILALVSAGAVSLEGAGSATSAASAALSANVAILGSALAASTGSAAISIAMPIAGSGLATASADADLGVSAALSGSATATVQANGDLLMTLGLSGAALAQALAQADVASALSLSGAGAATAAGQGAITLTLALAGDAIAQAQAQADLVSDGGGFSGAAVAQAAASADLVTKIPLAGNATAYVSGTGSVATILPLQGAAAAAVGANGALLVTVTLNAQALASALAQGELSATEGFMALQGVALAQAVGNATLSLSMPLSGAAIAQAAAHGALNTGALPILSDYTVELPALELWVDYPELNLAVNY
jgi:hypothetical protein